MTNNHVKDISRIYLEQISISEAVDQDSDGDNDFADVRIARMIASGVPKEVAVQKTKNKLYNKKTKSVKEALIGRQTEIDANKNNKIDAQDFKILRSSKKKKIKEGFSNWREDLIEVVGKIEGKDGKEPKVTEKQVNNKVNINPKLDLGEAIEDLGGELLEMIEIENFEGVFDELSESEIFLLSDELIEEVVEEFFYDCIQEGYDIEEIENQLLESIEISSSLLIEEDSVKSDRLEKVRGAVKRVGKALARGVGYAAGAAVRGVKALGREVKSGYSRGRHGASSGEDSGSASSRESQTTSTGGGDSEDSGEKKPGLLSRIGSKLKRGLAKAARAVSRGARNVARRMEDKGKKAEAPKAKPKKEEKPASKPQAKTTSSSSSVNLDNPQGSATYRGTGYEKGDVSLKGPQKTSSQTKPQAKTTTIPAPTSKKERKKIYQDVLADVSGVSDAERRAAAAKRKKEQDVNEDYYDLATKSVKSGKPGEDQKRTIEKLAKTATTKKKKRTPVGTARRGGGSFKPSSPEEAKADKKSWGDYWSTAAKGYKEEYVNEKTLTSAETKEKERLVKSMKGKAADFEKRYPGRGKEVMYATATKMAKRIAENFIDEAKLPRSEKQGKKQRQSKTLKLTDCDDCTHDQRHPDAAKIHVVNPKGEKTHSLTPGEFAKHQLPSGHRYGFDEFRKTKIVKDTTKPNKRVVGYLNREDYSVIDERIRRYPEQRGVTARGSMDDNRGFTQDMKSRIGVKNLKAVHFVGDIKTGSGPEKKAKVAKQIVSKRPDAKEVHFVDDHPGNVKAVADTLAKPGKTVKGKVGRTRETGPKVKGFVAKPATKSKGTVKAGEVVPVRLGGEGREGNRGIRSGTSPSKSPKETQRRRKQQRMGEEFDNL